MRRKYLRFEQLANYTGIWVSVGSDLVPVLVPICLTARLLYLIPSRIIAKSRFCGRGGTQKTPGQKVPTCLKRPWT